MSEFIPGLKTRAYHLLAKIIYHLDALQLILNTI